VITSRDKYKIQDDDYDWPYFLTGTTVNWLPLFSSPEVAKIVFDSLRFLVNENRLKDYGYVLMENQFWQEGHHPKRILDDKMMWQKIEYVHHNPVRRGYVDEPEHWRYSSARVYAGMEGELEVCMEWCT